MTLAPAEAARNSRSAAVPDRPFAESCVENRVPIFAVLQPRLCDCRHLLEIGSGTGQHAVYFAADLPHLVWQTSDRAENHPGIMAWLAEAALPNVEPPVDLDVLTDDWPASRFDAVFSANTAHIMSTAAVEAMFRGVGRVLRPGGLFLLYGPESPLICECDGANNSSYDNPEYDELFRQVRVLPPGPERAELVARMVELFRRDAVWLFAY